MSATSRRRLRRSESAPVLLYPLVSTAWYAPAIATFLTSIGVASLPVNSAVCTIGIRFLERGLNSTRCVSGLILSKLRQLW